MNAQGLLAHYELICDAPAAIARLRRFILDLAVRGKLVPQDQNDEPALDLLKRIADEKARRVTAGDLRKPRELDNGKELVEPFSIPSTWRWARLDAVGAIVGGGTPSATDADNFAEPGEGTPWLTPADLGGYSDLYIERGSRDLSEKGLRASSATLMPTGTVLFTSRAPIGYVAIASNPISTNQGFKSIVPYIEDCSHFIATVMKAFASDIDAKAPGTTFKEVSGKIVSALPFPLPPLAEQHRIVATVEELMGLCDRLEAAQSVREVARDRLAAARLARLNAPDPKTFQADARSALEALPALTSRPDQIKRLRQSILSLAVSGRLVQQDRNDEPASDLLKRIAEEKAKTGRAGVSRETQPSRDLDTDLVERDLPSSWKLVSVSDVLSSSFYGPRFGADEYISDGVPTIRTTDMTADGRIVLRNPPTVSIPEDRLSDFRCLPGDLLVTRTGSIGSMALFDGDYIAVPSAYLIRLRFSKLIDPRYLHLLLRSPSGQSALGLGTTRVAQPNINAKTLSAIRVPLPPLAEQHRIVAKVDAILTLCDRLEASLSATAATRCRLLDALLAEALAPVPLEEAA